MASSSVFLRSICRKGFDGSSNNSIFGKWTAGSGFSLFNSGSSWFYPRGAHQMSTVSEAVTSSPSRVQNSSPWLMLPPVFEGGVNSMSYKFYSLAENKVLTLSGSGEKELTDLMPKPNRLRWRGSSHGWLALINPHNLDLFLYNPLSRRHIKLPPIHNLPNYPNDYVSSRDVDKVILSCSPDEDEENCRAVIIYNCINGLAFCCPGRSKEWTLIGDMRWWDEGCKPPPLRGYEDCVYSTRQKVLFGLTKSGELESWDLQDLSSPRVIKMTKKDDFFHDNYINEREHLVVTEEQDLLVVTQYVLESMGPDGSYALLNDEDSQNCPYMTKDFNIQKYDPEEGDLKYVDSSSLGGLTLFLGFPSHSVALPATQFPELKPNSIYFTDPIEVPEPLHGDDVDEPFGGHDIGIFNYEDKTVSPCYYPCDVQSLKRIAPPPMWFFPSLPVPI